MLIISWHFVVFVASDACRYSNQLPIKAAPLDY